MTMRNPPHADDYAKFQPRDRLSLCEIPFTARFHAVFTVNSTIILLTSPCSQSTLCQVAFKLNLKQGAGRDRVDPHNHFTVYNMNDYSITTLAEKKQ